MFYFFVFNAVLALTNGGFRIVSDTLVIIIKQENNERRIVKN